MIRIWDIINEHTGGVPEIRKDNYFEVLDKIFEKWWGADGLEISDIHRNQAMKL